MNSNVFHKIHDELPIFFENSEKINEAIFQQLVATFKQILLNNIKEKSKFFDFKIPEDTPKHVQKKFVKQLRTYVFDISKEKGPSYGIYEDNSKDDNSMFMYVTYPSKKRKTLE